MEVTVEEVREKVEEYLKEGKSVKCETERGMKWFKTLGQFGKFTGDIYNVVTVSNQTLFINIIEFPFVSALDSLIRIV